MPPPPSLSPPDASTRRSAYTSGQFFGAARESHQMALLALSHTPLEDQLYRAMLSEVISSERLVGAFSVRGLTLLTGINSSSSVRRSLAGLLRKLSIQRTKAAVAGRESDGFTYQIFTPEEIFRRRVASGLPPYPEAIEASEKTAGFYQAIERVAGNSNLSRREAQVALACVEGLTNAEIGRRLYIGEQTVKFHLRNIFAKFGVRRRTELISRLLVQEARTASAGANGKDLDASARGL